MKYIELLAENKRLKSIVKGDLYQIKVLSNITLNQIKEITEYALRSEGINVDLNIANYDNLIQESRFCENANSVLVFWELCNFIEGAHYKVELFNEAELADFINKAKTEIDFLFANLSSVQLLLFNRFSSINFNRNNTLNSKYERLAKQLNSYIEQNKPKNLVLVDIERVIASIGVSESCNPVHYSTTKALYSHSFFMKYITHVKPHIMATLGRQKKVLVFDCDNTLWKGTLGEDGFEQIEMSATTKFGAIFHEVQTIALALNQQGVILALCSKNNADEVQTVINEHQDFLLKDKCIAIKKVNWNDKASNLQSISETLNIGLDSIVFIDDSDFEINLIKAKLPEVNTFKVPTRLLEYPAMMREIATLFYQPSNVREDNIKTKMYKEQVKRQSAQVQFTNIDDYLASLQLKMSISIDAPEIIPRMAQLTQKTNQFNLTTHRYTENEIRRFVESDSYKVFAFSVSDKFGDSGVTGLAIIHFDKHNNSAEIDTFLMSCRVIGRNLEHLFLDQIIEFLSTQKINELFACYCETTKNSQVSSFYPQLNFKLMQSSAEICRYVIALQNYAFSNIDYIETESLVIP